MSRAAQDALEAGKPAVIDAAAMDGPQRAVLPMNLGVVTFPEPVATK